MTTLGTSKRSATRTRFACSECGHETAKWEGRCPGCSAWNTFREWTEPVAAARPSGYAAATPVAIGDMVIGDEPRLSLSISEFDRVLGGGVVPGSLILMGGDPGIGKSTLVLQAASAIAQNATALYVSAEESVSQVKMRADRLGLGEGRLLVLPETSLDSALRQAEEIQPALVIVDSIQTVFCESAGNSPGSIAQLRECAGTLMRWAKSHDTPVMIIGHVTKDGDIAGPRLLEHVVDVVLYLEGERFSSYRLLRAVKNRFGSVDEVGVFEMTGAGMRGVENPSEAFIAERAAEPVGSAVVPVMEGSRPVLVELQALTSPTTTPAPRRTANGLDTNRLVLVTAVLTRRLNLPLAGQDVIANVVGGLRVHEPAADLGLALAICSSHRDRALPRDLIALGEVGLSGELRSVSHLERRLLEAERLGFERCLLPESTLLRQRPQTGIALLAAPDLRRAAAIALE
ncbi:MAG TPA: DNA repair protein RadA [Dehalococcoidia bacterium]|nr:DNA repair protein RadA [Dehalococcoidia bacterium]